MGTFDNFKPNKAPEAQSHLPAGGYVAHILEAKIETFNEGTEKEFKKLLIGFDIFEGEFTGFFQKQYDANTAADKKWKGVYRLNIRQETDEYYESFKRSFEDLLWALEESNPKYQWADDASISTFRGKYIGVLFRNFEWEINGNSGWSTEACKFTDVEAIRNGTFKIPKDRALKKKTVTKTATGSESFMQVADDADELPFA